MKRIIILALPFIVAAGAVYADELALSNPLTAEALADPTCLHAKPDAQSEYVVCVQEGAAITLVARAAEKAEVSGVPDYWWKVELPDGSYAWVFGAQIKINKEKAPVTRNTGKD